MLKKGNLKHFTNFTSGICEIFKNTYSEKHKRTAASMGRLFRKVFQMPSSWYSSRLKAVIYHVCKYKKAWFLLVHWMAIKNKLLSEWKCPELVVRRCSVKKLFLNILESFQENTCSEVSFYQSYSSQGLSSEFCEIFNDTHMENCVLFSSVQEWLVGCLWPFWCVYTINLVLLYIVLHV